MVKPLRDAGRNLITWAGGWLAPLPKPEKWLFIAGCYNSGTSVIQTLLAHHPQIGSQSREGQLCTDQLLLPKAVGLPRLWALEPEHFLLDEKSQTNINPTRLKRQWGLWMNDAKRPILMEKTPANVARLPWLQANFENAHFLGIIRNGYAVAEGIHRKAGHSLELAATQWLRSNEIMLDHFDTLQNRLLISYEELTDFPDQTLARVLSFLNLPNEGLGQLDGRIWSIHGEVSPLVNMNARSLETLTKAETAAIEQIAAPLLTKLGYTP